MQTNPTKTQACGSTVKPYLSRVIGSRIAWVFVFLIVAMTARSAVPSCYCIFGDAATANHQFCDCTHDRDATPHPTCCFEICDAQEMLQPGVESVTKPAATYFRNAETLVHNTLTWVIFDPPCVASGVHGRFLFRLHQRILC